MEGALRGLDRRARERFFVNRHHHGGAEDKRETGAQLEAHIGRVLTLIQSKWPPSTRAIDGASVYTGAAGVALLYLHLHHLNTPATARGGGQHLDHARQYIKTALRITRSRDKQQPDRKKRISFVTGDAGVYAVAAAIYHAHHNEEKCQRYVSKLEAISSQFLPVDERWDEWELLYGCAGYMYALHFVKRHTGKDIATPLLTQLVPAALAYGRRYATEKPRPGGGDSKGCARGPPLMYAWHDKEYFAVAHGISGILMILLMRPELLESWQDADGKSGRALVEETIDWLITTKFPSGNYPTRTDGEDDRLVQWCHGAPAIGLLLHRAYEVYNKAIYLREAQAVSEVVWARGLLRKGVGLCHGISGNAYIFLYLFRSTHNDDYLHRALAFARFSFSDEAQETWNEPDEPYSLFNGLAGSVWFCADLLHVVRSLLAADEPQARLAAALDAIYFPSCDLDAASTQTP